MTRRFFLQTVGCQMNTLDSELVADALRRAGHRQAESIGRADVILLNTCSVRQHAEDKIYSLLGRLKEMKQRRPATIIGVLGCMAQKDQHEIFRRAPHVDFVVGPGQLELVPSLVEDAAEGRGQRIEVSLDRVGSGRDRASVARSFARIAPRVVKGANTKGDSPIFADTKIGTVPRAQAMVRVAFGCDKFCSYCIVPSVRGPEQSRPAKDICDEVRLLADRGCLEITLLGQTVNSYRDTSVRPAARLSDLLFMLHEIEGVRRLRFVTNHPAHMTDDLIEAVRDLPKVSPYFHVPAQSGSNAVLQRMKRGYTVEEYRDMLARIRENVPGAAVTSDFIVGFCGETEEDFRQTADLVRDARFKNSFIFKYSTRPGTKADELFADDVHEAVKRRRNNELLAIQNAICLEDVQLFLGRTVEILVEGPSKATKKENAQGLGTSVSSGSRGERGEGRGEREARAEGGGRKAEEVVGGHDTNPQSLIPNPSSNPQPLAPSPSSNPSSMLQLVGRTTCDRIVVFEGGEELIGRILPVTIEKVDPFTLFGRLASP